MQVDIIDHLPEDSQQLVHQVSRASFYHTPVWLDGLSSAFPWMRFRCLVARDGVEIAGFLPYFVLEKWPTKRLWSLPFGTYGGPVARESDVDQLLIDHFMDLRRARGVLEVGLVDYFRKSNQADATSAETTHVLRLDANFETVWGTRFEKSKRRQARKAEREGIRIQQATSLEEVDLYYDIYERRSREWRQRIRYPRGLFIELFQRGGDAVKLFLARLEGRVLGGHLNFYHGDSVVAWNGVTTPDSRGVQASTLLYTFCIRHACENGFSFYNLGSSLGKTSLIEYKKSLGGEAYHYRVIRWRSLGGKMAAALRRWMPRR